MCDKAMVIMDENNWNADVDRLFLAILEHLSNDKNKLIGEYSVKELCDICTEVNKKLKIKNLNYPKNILFSNSSGRDYIIFSEDFDVDGFTKKVNGGEGKIRRKVDTDYGDRNVYINPKYIDAVYAGKNEKIFINEFEGRYGKNILKGKKFFGKREEVNISVDNLIFYNKRKVLLEIDSGNMAKLLVGQYFLLNELIKKEKEEKNDGTEYMFVVIHYYKDYNPERTNKNLKLVENCIGKSAIRFRAFTQKTFMDFYNGNDIKGLVDKLFDNNIK